MGLCGVERTDGEVGEYGGVFGGGRSIISPSPFIIAYDIEV